MDALDQLIYKEEQKIDHLIEIRTHPAGSEGSPGLHLNSGRAEDLDYDIEKAWEQLAIYKIRKYMGFEEYCNL
jgi:hypothetical protein